MILRFGSFLAGIAVGYGVPMSVQSSGRPEQFMAPVFPFRSFNGTAFERCQCAEHRDCEPHFHLEKATHANLCPHAIDAGIDHIAVPRRGTLRVVSKPFAGTKIR